MNRREALKTTTALIGAGLAAGCDRAAPKPRAAGANAPAGGAPRGVLDADDQRLADAIADTLLPATAASPGAAAAGAGAAMNLLLTDCYEPDVQRRVARGLDEFRAECRRRTGRDFLALPAAERERVLRAVDAEAVRAGESHYLGPIRELAERAYFSSEVGTTRALRYVRVPGRWDGCVPLRPGQPAWA